MYIELDTCKSIIRSNGFVGLIVVTLIITYLVTIILLYPIYCISDEEIAAHYKGRKMVLVCNLTKDRVQDDNDDGDVDMSNENDDVNNNESDDSKGRKSTQSNKVLGKRKATDYDDTESEQENNTNKPSEKALGKRRALDQNDPDSERIPGWCRSNSEEPEEQVFQRDMQKAIENSLKKENSLDPLSGPSKTTVEQENNNNTDDSDNTSCYSSLNGTESPRTYEKKVSLLQRDEYIKEQQRDTYFPD